MTIKSFPALLLGVLVCALAATNIQTQKTDCVLQKSSTSLDADSKVVCTTSGAKNEQQIFPNSDKTEGSFAAKQSGAPLYQQPNAEEALTTEGGAFDRDVRASGGNSHQFMRFGRNHNFMRFGRDVNKHNFMRFGRDGGDADGEELGHKFMRFGRPDRTSGHNFMRFGRPDSSMGHNFMRFGRPDGTSGHNFMRFGRPDRTSGHNFMRFGRPDSAMNHNFMRFGRPDSTSGHNFMRFGRASDEEDTSDLYDDDYIADDSAASGSEQNENLLPELAAFSAQEALLGTGNDLPIDRSDDDDDVTTNEGEDGDAFQRVVKNLQHKFMRFGRGGPSTSGHNFMRFGRIPEHTFMRFGRSGAATLNARERSEDGDHDEASALAPAAGTTSGDQSSVKVKREGHMFMRFGRRRR